MVPAGMADDVRRRKRRVRCDFSFLRRDLSVKEMHDFVEQFLRVSPLYVDRLQWNGLERCLYLGLNDPAVAEQLVLEQNGRHAFPPGRRHYRVYLKLVDTLTDVLLYDLSELVTDDQIKNGLRRYGTVFGVWHKTWAYGLPYDGCVNGHRVVRMVIRQPIPPIVRIGGELTYVAYGHVRGPVQRTFLQRTLMAADRALHSVERLPMAMLSWCS